MNPIDARPAALRIHRPGSAQDQDRNPVNIGIENRHARVLQADHVVYDGDHGLAFSLGVTVGNCHGNFLVITKNNFRLVIAAVIDNGIVNSPERRAWIERRVFDIKSFHQIDHDIRTVLRLFFFHSALWFGHFLFLLCLFNRTSIPGIPQDD